MPESHREILDNQTLMVLWTITETESDLQTGLSLSAEALQRLSQRKSSVHRKGYLAIRQLLKSLDIPSAMHQYDEKGAPFLTDGRCISITHSGEIAAVAISPTAVGIDLEPYKEKIKRVASRFLHRSELQKPSALDEIHYLTQLWTAKEALYKLYKKPGLVLKEQLCIDPFHKGASQGRGTVIDQSIATHFPLEFRHFTNYCLTLATTN